MGRGLFVFFLCLSALLLAFIGAQREPLAYLLAGILVPLPVLLVGWRLGEVGALLLALITAAALFCLQPGLEILWQNLGFLNLLLMGVLLASLQARGVNPPKAIIFTVIALSMMVLAFFLGQSLVLGVTLPELLASKSAEIMATVHKVLGGDGVGSPLIPGVGPDNMEATLQRLLPALLVTNTGLVAWLNVVLARQLAFLLHWGEPKEPLFHWTVPEWLIFVLLAGGFLLLVPLPEVRLFSLNLLIVVGVLYFCQGVAVVSTWFHRLGVPRLLRLLGYPLLFLNPFFFLIITLGLMDLWLDFRRLHQPKDA